MLISRHWIISDSKLIKLIGLLDKVVKDDQVLDLAHERS